MKNCPACLTQYTDDTLQYCLQDGTPLVDIRQADVPTVALGEADTVVQLPPGDMRFDTQPDGPKNAVAYQPSDKRSGSRTAIAVAITAFVMFIIFGLLGLASFLYFRDRQPVETANVKSDPSGNIAENKNADPQTSPSMTPRSANRPANSTPPAERPGAIDTQTRAEITGQIDGWRSSTEEMDLDALMGHYAASVDYYTRKGASIDFIRKDKNRAFSQFEDISLKITNIVITPNDSDDGVTAVFDKEWRFRGERGSTGKVRQQLQLEKIGGRWLITAEQDLRVY